MNILTRLKRLEDDMFQRKIDEKLKEYGEKYGKKFEIYFSAWGNAFLSTERDVRAIHILDYELAAYSRENIYNALCDCEDKIKVYLFDEEKEKEMKENGVSQD